MRLKYLNRGEVSYGLRKYLDARQKFWASKFQAAKILLAGNFARQYYRPRLSLFCAL